LVELAIVAPASFRIEGFYQRRLAVIVRMVVVVTWAV
jgi:hypothetical protein